MPNVKIISAALDNIQKLKIEHNINISLEDVMNNDIEGNQIVLGIIDELNTNINSCNFHEKNKDRIFYNEEIYKGCLQSIENINVFLSLQSTIDFLNDQKYS